MTLAMVAQGFFTLWKKNPKTHASHIRLANRDVEIPIS